MNAAEGADVSQMWSCQKAMQFLMWIQLLLPPCLLLRLDAALGFSC